jgi:hypothetical protein
MKKRKLFVLFSILVLVSLLASPAAASDSGPDSEYDPLKPGIPATLVQKIPINLILIGYEPAQVAKASLLAGLPATYAPVVRYPQFYGETGRDMGLGFNFSYKVTYTDKKFEDKFFKYLAKTGVPGDLTVFQQDYNDQTNNILDVAGPVLYLDAPSVEKWLESHTRNLRKNANNSYTVYFINWYGRSDFQFHVYSKTDEPDPDTNYNFGEARSSRKMIAWGGSQSRTWFYDLSAGPEAWTDNWNVDNPDLDGDGIEDYRMPAIWEYSAGGFRDPAALASDLGLVTRFVAINLLFTSSPLYDPMNTTPGVAGNKVTHIEVFEDDPASSGMDWISQSHIYSKMAAFQPYYNWQVNIEDNAPIDAPAERTFRIWAELLAEDDCWNAFGTPFAQLYCYFTSNLSTYLPGYDPEDYVGEIFAFNTTAANLAGYFGLLGYADDNWVDGTQTHVFEFGATEYRDLGYGLSDTAVHEFGHHIGLSHPHDGYDSELKLDYSAGGDFYFANSGDESNTVMSYITLAGSFGQFDQDNMYRYETAGYLQMAAELLAEIQAHPDAKTVKGLVKLGTAKAKVSVTAFNQWKYLKAAWNARMAYDAFATAAELLGIPLAQEKPAVPEAPRRSIPMEGDPIRYPDK